MRAVDEEHTSNSEGGTESGNCTANGQSFTHPDETTDSNWDHALMKAQYRMKKNRVRGLNGMLERGPSP